MERDGDPHLHNTFNPLSFIRRKRTRTRLERLRVYWEQRAPQLKFPTIHQGQLTGSAPYSSRVSAAAFLMGLPLLMARSHSFRAPVSIFGLGTRFREWTDPADSVSSQSFCLWRSAVLPSISCLPHSFAHRGKVFTYIRPKYFSETCWLIRGNKRERVACCQCDHIHR